MHHAYLKCSIAKIAQARANPMNSNANRPASFSLPRALLVGCLRKKNKMFTSLISVNNMSSLPAISQACPPGLQPVEQPRFRNL